jgi:hypothetical protein
MGVFDIVMEKPTEVSRGDGSSAGVSMTVKHTPLQLSSAGFP